MISNNLLLGNFIVKGFKMISFLLDHAVYWLAAVVYKAFYYLANATLLNDAIIENFTRRIYAIIGILMIFVLAFNLLNYIVDPDKMNDKKTGASAIIKDIVIALVILTLLPTIFTKLYSLQSQILSSGVIENLILGGYSEETVASYEDYMNSQGEYSSLTDYYINNGANMMIANVFIAFLTPNDNFSVLDCGTDTEHEDYCNAYQEVKETGDIDAFGDLYLRDDYSYFPFLSTVGGVVLLFFILSFCLNLGKRAGKMALLQLIAPIPVVMEILPTKKGSRKTWLDMLIKSFLEVFLFLVVIYVVIFLISLLPDVIANLFGNGGNFGLVKIITLVMLIFGLLQFGKEAPQMIFDILGIKSTGMIKAAAQRAVAMGGVAGGLLGSTPGRFFRNLNATDGNIGQKLASGFAGAASGFGRTLWGARNVHNLKDAKALRTNVNKNIVTAKVNRDAYSHAHGDKLGNVILGHAQDIGRNINLGTRDYMGMPNEYQKKKYKEQINQQVKKIYNDKISGAIFKNDATWTQIKSMMTQAEANGGVYVAADGSRTSYSDLKTRLEARENTLLTKKENAVKVLEAIGEIQNFNDANQGVEGISKTHHDLSHFIKSDGTIDKALYDTIINDVKTNGFDKVLSDLQKDGVYQQQKVQEKLASNAKEAAAKAAQEANNKGKK